jgi:serpin B
MWRQKGMPLQPEFVDVLESAYRAVVNLLDFRERDAACAAINRWVENNTERRIREVIAPGLLNDDTRLALVNAVYFKALWESPFYHRMTREENFYLAGGGTVRTSMMSDRKGVGYLKADGFRAVDLAYRGGQLSMLIVLPDRRDGLRYLESDLTASMLHRTVAGMGGTEVEIYLPKFRRTLAAELTGSLPALGMPLAFDRDRADSSGINGLMPPPRVSPPVFRADQPFLFGIRDLYSGMILFMGRVMDPTREG